MNINQKPLTFSGIMAEIQRNMADGKCPCGNELPSGKQRCDKCQAAEVKLQEDRKNQARKAEIQAFKDQWAAICPPMFQKTVASKIPDQKALKLALTWDFGPQGLMLFGNPGGGKSRTAWLAIWHAINRSQTLRRSLGRKTLHVLTTDAGFEYAACYSEGAAKAHAFIVKAQQAEILLMDDVFKSKPTESWEAALFSIVDDRMTNERPCVITMNDTEETLKGRLSQDRGPALVRRLMESCLKVHFNK